ncbi:MAG: tape measure protein [Sphingomonas sp.]
MKLSMILEAVDRWSRPTDRAGRATSALTRGIDMLGRVAARARGGISRFWNDTARGERIGQRVGRVLRFLAIHGFDALRWSAMGATRAIGGLLLGLAKLGMRHALMGVTAIAAAAGAAIGVFAHGVITTAAKFEQFQVALESTEGSAQKAKAAMAWVADFAQRTPYEIDEVTDAFVRARGIGLDPFTGAFESLGNAAGATRKTLMDAVEMMADAQTGEFERLKEFNITSSVKGQMVTFSYLDKAGKNAKKTVKKDMVEVRKAILAVFDDKYTGGMERQSQTLIGIWSNIKDFITRAQLSVANKGIFDRVKNDLQGVLDWTQKIQKDGSLDKWAQSASDWLTMIWDKAEKFIKETDWKSVATGIGTIVSTLVSVVGWIGKAAGAWGSWQNDVERRRLSTVVNSTGFWGTGLGQPSAQEKADARRQLDSLNGGPQRRQVPTAPRRNEPTGATRSEWNRALSQPPAAAIQGKISLQITADRGVGVRPTAIAASGVDLDVNTGRAMGGFA